MVPDPTAAYGLDGSDKTTDGFKGASADVKMQDKARTAGSLVDGEDEASIEHETGSAISTQMLRLAQEAYSQGTTFHQTAVRPQWVRSYRAYANQHFDGSKYLSKEFFGRSKIFRPKTRSAVRRAMAQAASALFSTGDVVGVEAQNQADPFQVASAAVKQEVMNYRLSRSTERNGIKWFLIATGAVQDAKITGLVISKQTWMYKERKPPAQRESALARLLGDIDPMTGRPRAYEQQNTIVEVDRPDIELFAPENVIFDPRTDWTDPAQKSRYIDLRYPMTADDAFTFIQNNLKNQRIPFKSITKERLRQYVDSSGPADALGVRAARQQGRDPIMLTSGEFGALWLHEWFIRWNGEDWCFWTINNTVMISEPVLTAEAYPEQGGARPVVIGYGAIEAHRANPMSPVESWQQMQQEINDQVNLRLDHMKQVTAPPMQVKRGQKVDLTQVQRRGANGVIMVTNIGDVEPLQIPDVPQSAFVENNYLNQDFDDLAGAFNPTGTEQSNKGASETLGGLSLLANTANTMGDFDLSVIIETWVAPVLRQIMRLEEMYESDATVLEICGDRAKLFEKFGVNVITDQMLMAETTLTVKAGVGASAHPAEKLQKFQMATQSLMQFFAPFVQSGQMQMPKPKAKEIADYVFGAVGLPEGAERFFSNMDQLDQPMPPQPPPPDPKAQVAHEKNQIDAQKAQLQFQNAQADRQQRQQETQMNFMKSAADRRAKLMSDHMKALAEIERAQADSRESRFHKGVDHAHDRGMAALSAFHDIIKTGAAAALAPKPEPQQQGNSK